MSQRISQCLVVSLLLTLQISAGDWPRFRGPDGQNKSDDPNIPTEWSNTKNLQWKTKMPGRGFSSPIVVGDRVFVTSYTGADDNLQNLKRQLVCVNRKNGDVLWSKSVNAVLPEFRSRGGRAYHGYASHTPVSDGEHVYVLFGTTGVLAYDMKGNKVWQKSVGTSNNSRFGSASSPILYKDMLIVCAGNESATIYAFKKKTGEKIWDSKADSLSSSYTTPLIVKNDKDEDELLISVAYEIWGMNPENGKLKWYAETQVDQNCCTSLAKGDGIVYAVGGRSGGRTAVKIGGKNDISKTNVVWSERGGSYVPSPVLHEGHLYWVKDDGNAYCVDAKTGKEKNRKRLGDRFYASILLIKDKFYAVSRFGGIHVFKADPEMETIAKNTFDDDSDFSATPAVSDGQLFIRSDTYLYCVSKKK